MAGKIRINSLAALPMMIGMCLVAVLLVVEPAQAITQIQTPAPEPGSYGLEATKPQPPPTVGATVATPGSGGAASASPTTVTGICPKGLLVEVYDNNVLTGSVMCNDGTFSLQITLFVGNNDITAVDYDDLGQPGPATNTNTITYSNAHFTSFGTLITLTSSYGRRSAPAGTELDWPMQLSGGNGPYAFSIDWGDGSKAELKSQSVSGVVDLAHTYAKAGIYQTSITVTDVNGVSAFLQVVSVASGQVDASTAVANTDKTMAAATQTKVEWIPAAVSVVLIIPTFWLGRQSQLISLRRKMERDREAYGKE